MFESLSFGDNELRRLLLSCNSLLPVCVLYRNHKIIQIREICYREIYITSNAIFEIVALIPISYFRFMHIF